MSTTFRFNPALDIGDQVGFREGYWEEFNNTECFPEGTFSEEEMPALLFHRDIGLEDLCETYLSTRGKLSDKVSVHLLDEWAVNHLVYEIGPDGHESGLNGPEDIVREYLGYRRAEINAQQKKGGAA
jgi:hypothetical protein